MQKVIPRPRLVYAGLAAITIALGLATRPLRTVISPASAENLGDALWAGLVFWLVAWLLPRQSSLRIALAAFAISATVECSQLYHVPWLDAVRRTVLGGLILGWGFSWTDF